MEKITTTILAFSIGIVLALSFVYVTDFQSTSGSSQSSSLNYKGYVCVYKNGELVECNHNILFNNGRNMTRDILGNGGLGVPIQNISLCNATAGCDTPVAAASEAFTAYVGCGLGSLTGTYSALNNAPGNWSLVKTFTSSCDNVIMNSTRLTNSTGGIFAGNTFSLVTLQTNDQITVNWTLMIT